MNSVSTGIPKLDKILNGGFPAKTTILVSGGPGTGKTLLGLNFLLDGAIKNEKCCYFSVNETPEELLRACKNLEALKKVENYLGKNLVFKHIELGKKIDFEFFTNIFRNYPEIDRIVIDSVNKLLDHAENKKSYRQNLSELNNHLKQKVKCSLILCETRGYDIDTNNGEAFDCDGVIKLSFLELEEKPKRILHIHKLRYTDFEPMVTHEFVIDKKGIRLTDTKVI